MRPTRQQGAARVVAAILAAVLPGLLLESCESPEDRSVESRLAVRIDDYDFATNPALLQRITGSAHGYFRFINKRFAQLVCERFRDDLALTPNVNLHGDAHVEQYAITDEGRGLTDFDDSSVGPAVFDLIRFGASLHLACEANGWGERSDSTVADLLRGYREALDDPEVDPPVPPIVAACRRGFTHDHLQALARADSLMSGPESMPERTDVQRRFHDQMSRLYPSLPASFFQIERLGRLRLGVGSALDEKYLLRVAGDTSDPDDDLILEVKEVRDLTDIDCILPTKRGDAFRVLVGQARISYNPYPHVGYVVIHPRRGDTRDRTFWVRQWSDNYHELSVAESFQRWEDLSAVAFDVGVQLGLGHPREIADPHEDLLRRSLLVSLDEFESDVALMSREMSVETAAAWRAFQRHQEVTP